MDHPGRKLRTIRERLKLTYRDVEQASQELARRRESTEFLIPLSRLADIENRGKIPSLFRLYTLCVIYRLDLPEVLQWYGIPADHIASDALHVSLKETHPLSGKGSGSAMVPQPLGVDIDLTQTTFLSHFIRQWGKVPLNLLNGLDLKQYRYGLVGLDDWSMFPILRPGSLVLIDEGRRKIARGGWHSEFDRPIYFLEHRGGFACSWCTLEADRLLLQPHPSSERPPSLFRFPDEIDVIGQVTGVAMLFEQNKRRSRTGVTVNKPTSS